MFIPSTGQIIFYISQCEGNMYYLFFNLICCLHVILVSLTFLIVLTLLMSLERENRYEASRLLSSSVRGFKWSCVGLMWRWRQQPLNKSLCWGMIAPVLLGYDSASTTYTYTGPLEPSNYQLWKLISLFKCHLGCVFFLCLRICCKNFTSVWRDGFINNFYTTGWSWNGMMLSFAVTFRPGSMDAHCVMLFCRYCTTVTADACLWLILTSYVWFDVP